MILGQGEKVMLVHRRLFESDQARLFVGTVDSYENGVLKITGHTWTQNEYRGILLKKEDPRTKIVSIVSGGIFAYELPKSTQLDRVKILQDGNKTFITDEADFKLDVSEKIS